MIIGINKAGVKYAKKSLSAESRSDFYIGQQDHFLEEQTSNLISSQAIIFPKEKDVSLFDLPSDFKHTINKAFKESLIDYSQFLLLPAISQYFDNSHTVENKLSNTLYSHFVNLDSRKRKESQFDIHIVLDFNEPDDLSILCCLLCTLKQIIVPVYSPKDIRIFVFGPEIKNNIQGIYLSDQLMVGWYFFQYLWNKAHFSLYMFIINQEKFSAGIIDSVISGKINIFCAAVKTKQAFYLEPLCFQLPEKNLGVDLINAFWKVYALERGYNHKNNYFSHENSQNISEALLSHIKFESDTKAETILDQYFDSLTDIPGIDKNMVSFLLQNELKIDPELVSAKIENEFLKGTLTYNHLSDIISQAKKTDLENETDLLGKAIADYSREIYSLKSKNCIKLFFSKIFGFHKKQVAQCKSNLKIILLFHLTAQGIEILIFCLEKFKIQLDSQVSQSKQEYLHKRAVFEKYISDSTVIEQTFTPVCENVWNTDIAMSHKVKTWCKNIPEEFALFDGDDYQKIQKALEDTALSQQWSDRLKCAYYKGWWSYCFLSKAPVDFWGLICSRQNNFKDKIIGILEDRTRNKSKRYDTKPLMNIHDNSSKEIRHDNLCSKTQASHSRRILSYQAGSSENMVLCLAGPVHFGQVLFNHFSHGGDDSNQKERIKTIFNVLFSESELQSLELVAPNNENEHNTLDLLSGFSKLKITELKKKITNNIEDGKEADLNANRLKILTWIEHMEI